MMPFCFSFPCFDCLASVLDLGDEAVEEEADDEELSFGLAASKVPGSGSDEKMVLLLVSSAEDG